MEPTAKGQVAVITDSAADLTPDLVTRYGIHVVPLYLILGENVWKDGIDITPPMFYELLKTTKEFPKTSQPNVSDFQELFADLSKDVEGIVAILVSSNLSGTVGSALAARNNLKEKQIEIIDTRGVSMMEGFIVRAAAQVACAGGDLQSVASVARSMLGKTHVYFIVDTFEYLYRGGRIGAAVKFLGSSLNIKPVLEISDGIAKPAAQLRTRKKALDKVVELINKQVSSGQRLHIAVVNVAAKEEASRFKEQLITQFQPVEVLETDVSPVLGAHVGPGTVGVAYYVED